MIGQPQRSTSKCRALACPRRSECELGVCRVERPGPIRNTLLFFDTASPLVHVLHVGTCLHAFRRGVPIARHIEAVGHSMAHDLNTQHSTRRHVDGSPQKYARAGALQRMPLQFCKPTIPNLCVLKTDAFLPARFRVADLLKAN